MLLYLFTYLSPPVVAFLYFFLFFLASNFLPPPLALNVSAHLSSHNICLYVYNMHNSRFQSIWNFNLSTYLFSSINLSVQLQIYILIGYIIKHTSILYIVNLFYLTIKVSPHISVCIYLCHCQVTISSLENMRGIEPSDMG